MSRPHNQLTEGNWLVASWWQWINVELHIFWPKYEINSDVITFSGRKLCLKCIFCIRNKYISKCCNQPMYLILAIPTISGPDLKGDFNVLVYWTFHLCYLQGSAYASQPPSAYDLFVTAAASDCIKLWDLRSNRQVLLARISKKKTKPNCRDILLLMLHTVYYILSKVQ